MKDELIIVLKTFWSTKCRAFYHGGKKFQEKSLHVLEDGASGVQLGDIKQVLA